MQCALCGCKLKFAGRMQNELKPGQCVGCSRLIPDTMISFPMECERHIACERCLNSRRITSFACPTQFCSVGGSPGVLKQKEEPQAAAPAEMSIMQARMKARYNEPLKPLSVRQNVVAAACASALETIGRLVDRNKPDTQSRDPRVLLDQRIPLTQLVNVHGMDITELINDHGINVNDFFERGYTMTHMCDAFSSRLNKKDGLAALYALGMSVDHFTMVPQYTQETVMRERLGYDPSWLLKFGYRFDPNKHTLGQLVGLGLTMPMVMNAGLRTKSQWEHLKRTGASRNELEKFGCTPQLEAELLLDMPMEQQRAWIAAPEPIAVQQDATPAVVVVRPIDPRSYRKEEEEHSAKRNNGVPRLRTAAEIQKHTAPRLVVLRK